VPAQLHRCPAQQQRYCLCSCHHLICSWPSTGSSNAASKQHAHLSFSLSSSLSYSACSPSQSRWSSCSSYSPAQQAKRAHQAQHAQQGRKSGDNG
jgi:hypothetical protein